MSVADDLTRTAIRDYLAGKNSNIDYVDCGRWADRVQILAEAFARGGQAQVNWEFNLMADDLDMAGLMADAPATPKVSTATPTPSKMLNIQYMLDQGANDEGNAQCLYSLYGKEFVYTNAYGYLWWNVNHWTAEGAEEALRRAATWVLKQRYIIAAKSNGGTQAYTRVMAASIPNAKHVRDCLYMFQMNVILDIAEFDKSPELLNCANGVLNLATGQLTPHSPEQRFTYCLSIDYDPSADSTIWQQFLTEVVGSGPEMVEYLQYAVGYSLTGYVREECLFYIYGPTRSGKGTFTETLLAILPRPLAMEVDFTTFTANRGADTQNFDLAPMKPARIIVASESNKYQSLNSGKIKSLTGGNEVYCAFKHRDHFSYKPQYKMWLVSNHPVNADVDDDAVWNRIKVIEFPNSFANREDTSLKLRMHSDKNLCGVFAWAIEGAKRWFALGAAGLGPHTPAAVGIITKQQRLELDFIQAWLDECCEYAPTGWTANEVIYRSYRDWCTNNGVESKKIRSFIMGLKAKGFTVAVIQASINQLGIKSTKRGVLGFKVL